MTAAEVAARLAASTRAALVVEAVGEGSGTVATGQDGDVLTVVAEGVWAPGGRAVRWRARSRWTVEGAALRVAWVRPGVWAEAVLDQTAPGIWTGRGWHVCGADRYAATLRIEPRSVVVTWTIRGPEKDARVTLRVA